MSRPSLSALLRVIEWHAPVTVPDLTAELADDLEGQDHLAARADADRAALIASEWSAEDGGPLPFEQGYEPAGEVG